MSVFVEIFRCILCCSEVDDHERDYETRGRDSSLGRSCYNSSVRNNMSVFVEIFRCILCCSEEDDRERDYETRGRDSSLGRSCYNSSVRNSSSNNHDLIRSLYPNNIYYYENYPNVSISSPTTKTPSAVSQQSDYSNNSSLRGTNEVSQILKSSRPSPPSSSHYTCPSSPKQPSFTFDQHQLSAKPPASTHKLSPSLGDSSQSISVPTPSSLKATTLSKPTLSPLPLDSKNQQTKGDHVLVRKDTSPAYATPKDNENLTKKDTVPKVLKTPLSPLSQKAPSSKPTLSPLPSDSKNQQTKGNHALVHKDTSPAYVTPKANENLTKKDAVPEVFKKPSPLSQKARSSCKSASSSKPTLSPLPPDSTNQRKKDSYIWVQKGTSSIYKIPRHIEDLIKNDIVPDVLKKPLSPSTYKDYFAALLYAEDFYYEKWSGFQLRNVTLELRKAEIYDKSLKNNRLKKGHKKDNKFFVAFEIDSVPARRPFLLSRDFVYAQHSGGKSKKFQGLLYRVVKSTTVLVEFEEGFYPQHSPSHKYDISFSFNRVCLKRAHQAIEAASDPLFHNFLFPDCASRKSVTSSAPQFYYNYKLDSDIISAVRQILSFEGQPPYLVEGPPLCDSGVRRSLENEYVTEFVLSKTGIVVREAVLQICRCSPKSRILICAPTNRACDVLMKNLMEDMQESDMFRANAAFREVAEVPDDILQASLLEGECFSCPSLQELRQFRVIFSTFVSSFRLHNEGITAGHFSHIFLVDASFAIEPETIIALSNLANENTTVIVTGDPCGRPNWVRSDIARENGLKISYFERLSQTKTYWSGNQMFYTLLTEESDISD